MTSTVIVQKPWIPLESFRLSDAAYSAGLDSDVVVTERSGTITTTNANFTIASGGSSDWALASDLITPSSIVLVGYTAASVDPSVSMYVAEVTTGSATIRMYNESAVLVTVANGHQFWYIILG